MTLIKDSNSAKPSELAPGIEEAIMTRMRWDMARADKLAKEYIDLPATGTPADRKRWFEECGKFLNLKLTTDPIEYKKWVDDRIAADRFRNLYAEITLATNYLESHSASIADESLLRVVYENYQNLLAQFLDANNHFDLEAFPELVKATQFFGLKKRIVHSENGSTKIRWAKTT